MTPTLHVTIGGESDRSDLEATLGAIDAGEDVTPRDTHLSVADLETFGRIFRPTNLELLEAIVEHEPSSLRELARLVDRHPPEVTDNVNELADYGLVHLVEEGRSKRPVVPYDDIEADIPLTDDAHDPATSVS